VKNGMKECLNSITKIKSINKDCDELHLTIAVSKKSMQKILGACKRIKIITVSKSTRDRISEGTKKIIKNKNINFYIKTEQGRPIDIPIDKMQKIVEMHKDYSYRDLADKLGVPKSTIHYLIKKSKKKKIKDGNKIIYLK
jgi:hypothetical protein